MDAAEMAAAKSFVNNGTVGAPRWLHQPFFILKLALLITNSA